MYFGADRPTILLCSLRPIGRQAMTCAHELGHHVFGHGSKVDEFFAPGSKRPSFDPDEWLADRFANFLLMPKAAVLSAFRKRGIEVGNADPRSVFVVACQLGVGYEALINHLESSLECVRGFVAERLRAHSPKQLRTDLVGPERADHDVVVVDAAWMPERPIDLQVGDCAILQPGSHLDGSNAVLDDALGQGTVVRAVRPGLSRVLRPSANWASFLRVSRRQYVGLARYRHLEDPDDD